MDYVKLWEERISILTLKLGPLNPNPVFETHESYHPYPYPYAFQMADKIKEDVEYITLNLENQYLKVIILPELGSRIYSIYDKVNEKELIHKPDFINMAFLPGTAGGTYVGVGMELSIPDHHSLTNSRKREFSTCENADGSKTVIVGELDLRYSMRWSMQFTLKPGVAALFQKVTIHNQSDTNGRFRYWSNAGVSLENKNIEFIFREKEAWEHGGEFQVMSWPLYDGIDMRFPAEIPNTAGFEPKDVKDGFFAYYDHKDNYGLVHWAPPGSAKGKKYWAWGKSANAAHRARLFGDGSRFMEFQSGRDEDQEIFEILEPAATVQWEEMWFPVGNLGTISDAAGGLAISADINDNGVLELKVQTAVSLGNIKISVFNEDSCLAEKRLSPVPGKVQQLDIPIGKDYSSRQNIILEFNSDDHRKILEYKVSKETIKDKYIDIIADTSEVKQDRTTDFLMSELRLRARRFPQPKFACCDDLLEEVLNKDPWHAEALKVKGISLHEKGLIDDSNICLRNSLQRNFCDGETYYYLGLNAFRKGEFASAFLLFSDAVKFNFRAASFMYLGIIAFLQNDKYLAVKMFRSSLDNGANHTKARIYLALTMYIQGNIEQSILELEEAEKRFLSDPLIQVAYQIIEEGTLKGFARSARGIKLVKQLHKDIQTCYQVVIDLTEIGFYGYALDLVNEISSMCQGSQGTGMLPFYKYFAGVKSGLKIELENIDDNSVLYTFPFRDKELEILSAALNSYPDNKFALYYSGLVLAGKTRYKEAGRYINRALEEGLEHPVVLNTAGRIAEKSLKDFIEAEKFYLKSLKIDPDNVFTRIYLADLFKQLKKFAELEKLFEHKSTFTNLQLLCKYIDHNIARGQLRKVIHVMENKVSFYNMARELYGRYSNVIIRYANTLIEQEKLDEAIEYINRCFEPQPQFGGRVWKEKYNLKAEYFLGLAYKLKGDGKKAEEIWMNGVRKQEQFQDWTMSGAWNYGLWVGRFYQGWMLKSLGRKAEAVSYFDGIRAFAAHKFNSLLNPEQRKDLLKMSYNGLNEEKIMKDDTDDAYLELE